MSDNEEALKQKARLLIAREREVLTLRRKQKRLGLWLTVAQSLPALIDPKAELAAICKLVSARLVGVLNLQRATFFELLMPSRVRAIEYQAASEARVAELPAAAQALLHAQSGSCAEPNDAALQALSVTVGLHRFLWYRMTDAAQNPVLLVVGFDRERASFYEPFSDEDLAHFSNTAQQLELLLANTNLLRALARENFKLQGFNAELERRVTERTSALAKANTELEHALSIVRRKDAHLEADIERARQFQSTLLPVLPASERVEFCSLYWPLERVGGDIYDVSRISANVFRIFLADATGHGVQAAMRTIVIKAEYDRLREAHASPNTLLDALGRKLWTLFPAGDVMTTACCLDVTMVEDGAIVAYANGGNPSLWVWQSGEPAKVHSEGPFLGIEAPPFPAPQTFRIRSGDLLLAFTDGLSEQADATGACFEDHIDPKDCPTDSAESSVRWLTQAFEAFRGECAVSDDVTLVALRLA